MMRTSLVAAAAACALVVAPSASAATKAVKITRTAFSPAAVTIKTGDAVKWTNSDTRNHQVVSDTGAFASRILKQNQSFTFTFKAAGKYRYHDALDPKLKGTVTVTGPPPAVSTGASKPIIFYGEQITLSGTVSNGKAGETVTVFTKPYPQASFAQMTSVVTTTNGAWDLLVVPTILTSYQVRWKTATSTPVTVGVRPKITLRTSRGYFSTRVTAGHSYAGRPVYLQRFSSFGQWVTVKKLKLGPRSGKIFKLQLARGVYKLRVLMTVNQAGAGYLDSTSNTLTYRKR